MNRSMSEAEAHKPEVMRYPEDLDITIYDDGRWRHAASYPDTRGYFREVYLRPLDGCGWGIRLHEHVASTEFQGETVPRWKDGLEIEDLGSGSMSYEMARGAAEVWIRGGRIVAVA